MVHAPPLPAGGGAVARIVAWSGGDRAHERSILRTLSRVARVVLCRTEPALWDEIAAGGDAIVIVELTGGATPAAPATAAVVQGVKRRFPAVPVLGYCWLGPAASAEIVACARAGLDALALRGYDDLASMVRRAIARERSDEAIVLLDLDAALPPPLQRWARVVLERARQGPNVGVVARALGCGPRTMQRAAREHGVAPPARIITCVRLLYAARLLAYRRLSVDEAALRAGYPSAVALRRAFRREGLAAPAELRLPARYAVARERLCRRIRGAGSAPERAVTIGPASPAPRAAPAADPRRASA